jgi:hypothetical protein
MPLNPRSRPAMPSAPSRRQPPYASTKRQQLTSNSPPRVDAGRSARCRAILNPIEDLRTGRRLPERTQSLVDAAHVPVADDDLRRHSHQRDSVGRHPTITRLAPERSRQASNGEASSTILPSIYGPRDTRPRRRRQARLGRLALERSMTKNTRRSPCRR